MTSHRYRCDAIRSLFSDLVKETESCIEGLINEAYSKDLIASSTQSGLINSSYGLYEKATKFWTSIQSSVDTDDSGQSFERLLQMLKTQHAITHLQTKLERFAQFGPDYGKLMDQPVRAFSGPYPGGSLSGQHPIANFSGASAATPLPKNTDANFVDSSNLSMDSGFAGQEPDSILSSNHDLSSTSEAEFSVSVDCVQPVEHASSSGQPVSTPQPVESSSVEETGDGTHTLVTPGGHQLVPQSQGCSTTTLVSLDAIGDALRTVRLDVNLKDAELSQAKQELKKSHAENDSLRHELEQLTKEKQDKDKEVQEKDEEINQLNTKIQEKEQQIARLETEIASFEKENEELKEKYDKIVKSMEAQQSAADEEIEALEHQYRVRIDDLQRSLKDAEDKKKDAEVELATLKADLATERWLYQRKICELKDIIADKSIKEARLDTQLAQERQKNAEIRAEVESDKRRHSEAYAKELEKKLAAKNDAEIRAQVERRRSEAYAKELEKKLAALRERYNETDTS